MALYKTNRGGLRDPIDKENVLLQNSNQHNIDPEMINIDEYNTILNARQKRKFNDWAMEESVRQGRNILMDKGSYDIQGFWLSGDYRNMDKDNHGSDYWKKPNHPTFSTESKYVSENNPGGLWGRDGAFYPSYQTGQLYKPDYYKWLFGKEPNRPEHYGGPMLKEVVIRPSENQNTNSLFNGKSLLFNMGK